MQCLDLLHNARVQLLFLSFLSQPSVNKFLLFFILEKSVVLIQSWTYFEVKPILGKRSNAKLKQQLKRKEDVKNLSCSL